jgi:cell division protein ZapA (FtsZ GTPase activity inhibitor)
MVDPTKHSIKLKIAGKEYSLVATQESEHYMRLAAERINQKFGEYDKQYPEQTTLDKLAFVALSEEISMLVSKRNLDKTNDEVSKLAKDLRVYLGKIEKNR